MLRPNTCNDALISPTPQFNIRIQSGHIATPFSQKKKKIILQTGLQQCLLLLGSQIEASPELSVFPAPPLVGRFLPSPPSGIPSISRFFLSSYFAPSSLLFTISLAIQIIFHLQRIPSSIAIDLCLL